MNALTRTLLGTVFFLLVGSLAASAQNELCFTYNDEWNIAQGCDIRVCIGVVKLEKDQDGDCIPGTEYMEQQCHVFSPNETHCFYLDDGPVVGEESCVVPEMTQITLEVLSNGQTNSVTEQDIPYYDPIKVGDGCGNFILRIMELPDWHYEFFNDLTPDVE